MKSQRPKPGRIPIQLIKTGTWEDENYPCPPAGEKTGSEVIKELNHESNHTLRKAWRERHDSRSEVQIRSTQLCLTL